MPYEIISEFPFRDRDLTKVIVKIGHAVHNNFHSGFDVHFEVDDVDLAVAVLADKRFVKVDEVKSDIERLAKWMILNGSYRSYSYEPGSPYTQVKLSQDIGTSGFHYSYIANNKFRITRPNLSQLTIDEHLLARKVVLLSLYEEKLASPVLLSDSHMPEHVIHTELAVLLDSGHIRENVERVTDQSPDVYELTLKGREYCENKRIHKHGTVFIIAACEDSNRPDQGAVLTLYKEVIRESGLDPIFQEHEEPEKNIHVDIFEYIDSADFVVADITYNRYNCYIEIGYAMARQKVILLYVDEECLFGSELDGKVPFDISVVKYQTYSRNNLDDLRTKLLERIKVVRERL